jgi:hypothetical protein
MLQAHRGHCSTWHRFPRWRRNDLQMCQNPDRMQQIMAKEAQQFQVCQFWFTLNSLTLSSKSRHAQLQMLAKDQQAAAGTNSGECSICLGSVLVSRSSSQYPSQLTIAALSILVCRALRSCMALQMHSTITRREKQHLSSVPVPELQSIYRSNSRGRRG